MSKNKKSQFQRYWSRIDNCPGKLEYATPEQLAEIKQMVKQAFHSGHGMYRDRITELDLRNKHTLESCNEEIHSLKAQLKAMPCYFSWFCDDDEDADPWCGCPACKALEQEVDDG
jgi:hypothetical protein